MGVATKSKAAKEDTLFFYATTSGGADAAPRHPRRRRLLREPRERGDGGDDRGLPRRVQGEGARAQAARPVTCARDQGKKERSVGVWMGDDGGATPGCDRQTDIWLGEG